MGAGAHHDWLADQLTMEGFVVEEHAAEQVETLCWLTEANAPLSRS